MAGNSAAANPPDLTHLEIQQVNLAQLNLHQKYTSLILVKYNAQEDLLRCLESIYACPDIPDQLIVFDNGSSDGGAQQLGEHFPAVQLYESRENLGFARGCNLGASHAGGEILVFLNPDTIVTPGWLQGLLAPFEADPQVGMVTSKVLLLDQPERINTAGNEIHISGLTLCRQAGQLASSSTAALEVSAVSGAAFAMRRALFEQLGGFDPDFFMYMEDTDLSWRLRLAGYTCLYVPDSLVYHRYALQFRPNKTYYQERNRLQMLIKNLRWGSLVLLLPTLLLAEVVAWGYVLAYAPRQWLDKPRAFGWVLRNWPLLLAKRRQAQALRRVPDRQVLAQHPYLLEFEQAGKGSIVRLAHRVFDPLFWLFRKFALALIRW